MKRFFLAGLLCLLLIKNTAAQTASFTIHIDSKVPFAGYAGIYDDSPKPDMSGKGYTGIGIGPGGYGNCTIAAPQPRFVLLVITESTGQPLLSYPLFLSPGDNISFKLDADKKDKGIEVSGKGSNNNQPAIMPLTDLSFTFEFRGDVLPGRAMEAIKKQQHKNISILDDYITKYKPSDSFIRNCRLNQTYFAGSMFYQFKMNSKYGPAYEEYLKNRNKWQETLDSLFNTVKLNNDEALSAYNYRSLITTFSARDWEDLGEESRAHPQTFYKEWYHTNIATGRKKWDDEGRNLLLERIINRYFNGKVAEFLYVTLIKNAIYSSNYQNIVPIFNRFKQKYPGSQYTPIFAAPLAAIEKRQNQVLNSKMFFVPGNGSKLNTLKDVLALTKGKTILVDMWGTWCGPCREEIEKNSAALESYFKGNGIGFLYIANDDMANEKQWKRLIAFYHMEGTHILANDKLTKDITAKVKVSGYPTYFIIKKDGSYKKANTQYPINRKAIIKELELAMK